MYLIFVFEYLIQSTLFGMVFAMIILYSNSKKGNEESNRQQELSIWKGVPTMCISVAGLLVCCFMQKKWEPITIINRL